MPDNQILPSDQSPAIREIEEFSYHVDEVATSLRLMLVDNAADASIATNKCQLAKDLYHKIEMRRKALIEPSRKFISNVNDASRYLTDQLSNAIEETKVKLAVYKKKEEQENIDKMEAFKELAKDLGISVNLYSNPETVIRASGATASTKSKYTFEVKEEHLVPVKYMMVDEKKIKHAIAMGIREIPGIEIKEEKTMMIRKR